ncbi:hypothetical protein [Bacillus kexueae]|nr:hypothetical protein [Bacillus kexueae]
MNLYYGRNHFVLTGKKKEVLHYLQSIQNPHMTVLNWLSVNK